MENEPTNIAQPNSIEELQTLVKDSVSIRVLGRDRLPGRPPRAPDHPTPISLASFNQIVEYLPEEYTITVQVGMTVKALQAALAEKGQYLPFDPPFASTGITVGAMIAKGLSGPGSFRYGILRDFILGVNFVDGLGNYIHTGGKVVKNAAGFDIPKLMTGSYGSFGTITEASFKVFPVSPEERTIVFRFPNFQEGHQAYVSLGRSRFTLDILDLDSNGSLFIRLAGQPGSMDQRVQALELHLAQQSEALQADAAHYFWNAPVRLDTPPQSGLLYKIPVAPQKIEKLEAALTSKGSARRYSIGGYVAWTHWESEVDSLSSILEPLNLSGQLASGQSEALLIGATPQASFYQRLKSAFDPNEKFINLYSSRPTESIN